LPSPVLVDGTVLMRLIEGGEGSDFAVNLFSRAESGLETLVTHSLAVSSVVAAIELVNTCSYVGTDLREVLRALSTSEPLRRDAALKVAKVADYLAILVSRGSLTIYSVGALDLAEAARLAAERGLLIGDAVTLIVAEKLGVSKIASFSRALRLRAPRGYTFLPS